MLLSSDIWVGALIRRAEQGGAFAVVARKGDARAGAVLVRLVNPRAGTVRLLAETLRGDGERIWMEPTPGAGAEALEAYVTRAVRIDPDLWVVEIEDTKDRHFLVEPVERIGQTG